MTDDETEKPTMEEIPTQREATARLADALSAVLSNDGVGAPGVSGKGLYIEADAQNAEVWVHGLPEGGPEDVEEVVQDFAEIATDEFGTALLFDFSVKNPSDSAGKTAHVDSIRFN